jgi:hypothetical protein
MAFSRLGWSLCLIVAPLYAGMVDVSSQSSVALHDGDTLTFAISAFSYRVHAPEFGAPADPPFLSFSLLTAPLMGALDLSFSLESYDGGVSAPVTDTSLAAGYFQGSLYQGPVTTEYGSLALSPELSNQIFAGPAVFLVVKDIGGDVSLGLPSYSLLQSLEVGLSGGGFNVGGTVAAVTLEQAPLLLSEDLFTGPLGVRPSFLTDGLDSGDPQPDAPEPRPGALLALGGALLGLLAHFSKRSRALD